MSNIDGIAEYTIPLDMPATTLVLDDIYLYLIFKIVFTISPFILNGQTVFKWKYFGIIILNSYEKFLNTAQDGRVWFPEIEQFSNGNILVAQQ